MFLLIQILPPIPSNAIHPLNSIMFLLILFPLLACSAVSVLFKFHYVSINSSSGILVFPAMKPFKFHYVSINSRPKTNCLFTPRNTFILSTSSKYIISFSLFIICFSNTSYFSHFLLLSIPCVFYTITGRQKSLYFYHIKFFISLTLPIMNPINQICNPNIQIHI